MVVVGHVHHLMATVHPYPAGCFQQDNTLCHKTQIMLKGFSGKDFTALRWSTKSSDLKSTIWMFGIGGFLKTKGAPAWYYQAVTDAEVSVIKKKKY